MTADRYDPRRGAPPPPHRAGGTPSTFGPCSLCGEPSVVRVNSSSACVEHIDEVVDAALDPVRDAIRNAQR